MFVPARWLGVLVICMLVAVRMVLYFGESSSYDLEDGAILKVEGRVMNVEWINEKIGWRLDVGGIKTLVRELDGIGYADTVVVYGRVNKVLDLSGRDQIAVYADRVELVSKAKGWVYGLYKFREWARGVFQLLPDPESALLSGIVMGIKADLPRNLLDELRKSGTSHMVVASGTNVAMVGMAVVSVGAIAFGKNVAVLLTIVSVWLFTAISGMGSPAVRAAIMASMGYIGLLIGRGKTGGLRMLLIAGLVMIFIEPSVAGEIGFQLSMAATMAVMIPLGPNWIPGEIRTVLSVQLFTLPIILWHFGWDSVAWIAPISNLFSLWLVAPIMLMGAMLLACALLGWSWLIGLWAGLTYVPVHALILIIRWFGS